ncbi:BRCT domain-containing protein [Geopyxis carbonaria]|nr:BRCT domain-containing protein [Geopyxis carbonaria]
MASASVESPVETSSTIIRSLFGDVVFHVVVSQKLPQVEAMEIAALLTEGGAKESKPRSSTATSLITIDLEEVTHIVAADSDFPGYTEAENLMVPVVKPGWVRHSVKTKRIAHVRPWTPDPRFFFSGVMATVADLPVGDKEAICGGILAMGGQFSNHLTKFTTHLVTLNMDNDKCRQAVGKKLNVKVVLPHWFDDCLKLGKRIDEGPYTLPNPEIERFSLEAPVVMPKGPDLTYSHPHKSGPMGQDPPALSSRRGLKIFEKKKVMLGIDLGLTERLSNVINDLIQQADGQIVEDVEIADAYICQYRDGSDYVRASRRGISVGSLTWLYWMFAHGTWCNPLNKLLHYPLVRGGIPEMKSQVITVSNYGGDARLYLETLVEACGAKFTKSMKADNTHLITARAHSEKYVAAQEWNINIVNHLWLEDTYAKWQVQSLTNPRYTHFPRRTNLMEIVGQTQIDRKSLEQFYTSDDDPMEVDDLEPSNTNAVEVDGGVRNVTPSRIRDKTTSSGSLSILRRQNQISNDHPEPPASSGRKAKEQAVARLHDEIMPDVNLYQKEQKRKGGVLGGRKRRSSAGSSEEKSRSGKRTASPDTWSNNEDAEKSKKTKKRPKPVVFLLITAYKGWLEQPQKEDHEKRVLAELGIRCVIEPGQCTHLAAPHLVRTEKFCCALAKAPVVVSTDWIEACIKKEQIVETESYLLKDSEGEKRLNINLESSLLRAKENQGQLLKGKTIYCTPGVHGGYEVCKRIVEANGGVCISFRMAKRPANTTDDDHVTVLLSSDEPSDKKLWGAFRKIAQSKYSIYRADWLLDLAMSQRIEYGEKYEICQN